MFYGYHSLIIRALWISNWISLDFYGYPSMHLLLWILDPGWRFLGADEGKWRVVTTHFDSASLPEVAYHFGSARLRRDCVGPETHLIWAYRLWWRSPRPWRSQCSGHPPFHVTLFEVSMRYPYRIIHSLTIHKWISWLRYIHEPLVSIRKA